MTPTLRAVLFDMGGTLEELYYTEATRTQATRGLQQLLSQLGLDPHLSLAQLQTTVLAGMKAYANWREATEIELPSERVWTEYIFPDHGLPKDQLMAAAEDITFYYESHFHAVRELYSRGTPEMPSRRRSI